MDVHKAWELFCFISSPLQTLAALVQLWRDVKLWRSGRRLGMNESFALRKPLLLGLLILGAFLTAGIGLVLVFNPPILKSAPPPVAANPNSNPAPQGPPPAKNPQPAPSQPQPTPRKRQISVTPASSPTATPVPTQPPAQTQTCIGSNCVQGPNYGNQTIVNPPDPEKSWQLTIAKCDQWVPTINALGPHKVHVGWFISDNDGARIAQILIACFGRTSWTANGAVLPANPDGVLLGAKEDGIKLTVLSNMLQSFGLRVSHDHDIRPVYGDDLEIIVGFEAVPGKSE